MLQKTFSFSRFQKLNFCKRAFYFRYKLNKNEFDLQIHNDIENINQSQNKHMASYQLKRAILRSFFYNRDLSIHKVKQTLAQEGNLRSLNLNEVDRIFYQCNTFKHSQLYIETEPCFVKWLELNDVSSFTIEETTVLGNIDFAWYDKSGVNLLGLESKQDSESKINFMLSYALRELKVKTNKINIGLFNPNEWSCKWSQINWHSYQEYLDTILSFNPPNSFTKATPVLLEKFCNTCEYSTICKEYSYILDT